jgi:hypothetical protein
MIMDYKTGDIFICRGNSLIAKGIRWATKSYYNHAAIFIEIWGQPYMMDSSSKGTNLIPFDEWEKIFNFEYVVYRNPNLTDYKTFSIRAVSKSGNTGYDFHSLLLRHPIEILTGKWKYKGEKENERMYCSEYTAWTHEIDHAYRMSPQDLLEYCQKFFILVP